MRRGSNRWMTDDELYLCHVSATIDYEHRGAAMSFRDITRRSVLAAIAEFDQLGEAQFLRNYGFGPARAYYLAFEGCLYPSKAVVGAAHGYAFPELGPLRSQDFTGGDATVKQTLESVGFNVVVRRQSSVTGYQEVLELEGVESELQRREEMWRALLRLGGPTSVEPSLLRGLGIYGGVQGVWVNKKRTKSLGSNGATVGLLHTGSSYADDLTDDAVLHHYPKTARSTGRDFSKVEATKTAGRLQLPVFVISYPSPGSQRRDVHNGWVTDWDDESGEFLIVFGRKPPPIRSPGPSDSQPFSLTGPGGKKARSSRLYGRDPQFKFDVFKRYGPQCAVCEMLVKEGLEAAHIRGKKDRGCDDPRNGLVLCATHHAAFDADLFAIEPATLSIHLTKSGPSGSDLGIQVSDIRHLRWLPHPDAMQWRWNAWTQAR